MFQRLIGKTTTLASSCYLLRQYSLLRSRIFTMSFSSSSSTSSTSYKSALEALASLQSNAAVLEEWTKRRQVNPEATFAEETLYYANRMSLTPEVLSKLSVIHVAGTKGKGSTCALVESILRHSTKGIKTGLFVSPHLVEPTERIRIDGKPLPKESFAKYFWDSWNLLQQTKTENDPTMPGFFRFLTLMALHVFLCEGVDVAILEVGIGGRTDATNIIERPVVCGITALGYDHMDVLGHTLEKIAGEKGGIFKQHIPAFTVPQQGEAMSSLLRIANSKPNPLFLTPPFSSLNKTGDNAEEVDLPQLGLDGNFQRENAALALSLSATWLTHHTRPELCWWLHPSYSTSSSPSPSSSSSSASSPSSFQVLASEKTLNSVIADPSSSFGEFPRHSFSDLFGNSFKLSEGIREGLKYCKWAGRCHTISPATSRHFSEATSLHKTILHLDGAHTPESTTVASEWFTQIVTASPSSSTMLASPVYSSSSSSFNILIFNCLPSRDPRTLLAPLLRPKLFDYVIFSPIIRRGGTSTAMSTLTKSPSPSLVSSISSSSSSSSSVTKWQQHTKEIWNELYRQTITTTELNESAVVVVASLEELLEKLKWIEDQVVVQEGEGSGGGGMKTLNGEVRKAKEVRVLVTGSLYLVGGVLGLLTEKGVPDLI